MAGTMGNSMICNKPSHLQSLAWSSFQTPSLCPHFLYKLLSSALDMSIISYDQQYGTKSSWRTDDKVMAIYEEWLAKHGKAYNSLGEKERRFQIFKDNLRFIDEHNSENHTSRVGLNRFADITNEEYRVVFLGARCESKQRLSKITSRYAPHVGESLPDSVDWRKEGVVAEVKYLGSCRELL